MLGNLSYSLNKHLLSIEVVCVSGPALGNWKVTAPGVLEHECNRRPDANLTSPNNCLIALLSPECCRFSPFLELQDFQGRMEHRNYLNITPPDHNLFMSPGFQTPSPVLILLTKEVQFGLG